VINKLTDLVSAEYGNMEASSQPVLIEDGQRSGRIFAFFSQLALS